MPKTSWLRPPSNLALSSVTAGIWALAAAGGVFWLMQWPEQDVRVSVGLPVVNPQDTSHQDEAVAKALGHRAAGPIDTVAPTSSPYKLMGIVVGASGQGSALIASGDQAPKAYRLGQSLQEGVTLEALTPRQARLKTSSGELLLELPAPAMR